MAHIIHSLSEDLLSTSFFPDITLVAVDHRETRQTKTLLSWKLLSNWGKAEDKQIDK